MPILSPLCPDPDPQEPPTVLLWVLVFLAQHYDMLHKTTTALEYIDKAIDHTPTHIELYMIKSKILKVNTPTSLSVAIGYPAKLFLGQ